MGLLKTFAIILFATTLSFFLTIESSYADGGFPVRPGRLLISPSVSYFFANSAWDTTGGPKKKNGLQIMESTNQ